MLGLPACVGFSLLTPSRGYPLAVVHGLLIVVPPLVAEHGLEDAPASVVVAHGLNSVPPGL